MLISGGSLKQILESPKGPAAAHAHVRPDPVVYCPSCKVRLYVNRRKYGGKRVSCPECGKPMLIPRASQESIETETPSNEPSDGTDTGD
jgi:hypothetical protein